MKLLYCLVCGDIVAPLRVDMKPRSCACGRHHVWWRDGSQGLISVHDTHCAIDDPPEDVVYRPPSNPRAWLLGITNSFLSWPLVGMSADDVTQIIDSHADWYLFKKIRSCVVRFRPGETADSRWERVLP